MLLSTLPKQSKHSIGLKNTFNNLVCETRYRYLVNNICFVSLTSIRFELMEKIINIASLHHAERVNHLAIEFIFRVFHLHLTG